MAGAAEQRTRKRDPHRRNPILNAAAALLARTGNDSVSMAQIGAEAGGGGIGRCAARDLAHLGAHVATVGRSEENLQHVQAEILADGGSASGMGNGSRNPRRRTPGPVGRPRVSGGPPRHR